MSPIEYIEKGIRQGDWETVCEGYKRLTGKALPFPQTSLIGNAEEALRQIESIVSSVFDGPIAEICSSTIKAPKKKPGRPKGRKKTVTKDGEDSSLVLDNKSKTTVKKHTGDTQLITNDPDPEEVKQNKVRAERAMKNKMEIKRQPIKAYKVNCNECGEPFESDRSQGELGQKCPRCLKSLKSIFGNG